MTCLLVGLCAQKGEVALPTTVIQLMASDSVDEYSPLPYPINRKESSHIVVFCCLRASTENCSIVCMYGCHDDLARGITCIPYKYNYDVALRDDSVCMDEFRPFPYSLNDTRIHRMLRGENLFIPNLLSLHNCMTELVAMARK